MYKQLNPRELEPFFSQWMDKLTAEELFEKADIACVLADQSKKISGLEKEVEELERERFLLEIKNESLMWDLMH